MEEPQGQNEVPAEVEEEVIETEKPEAQPKTRVTSFIVRSY